MCKSLPLIFGARLGFEDALHRQKGTGAEQKFNLNAMDYSIVVSLLTLTALELVLGIDNIVLISILTSKLPEKDRPMARRLGLVLALVFRVLFLFCVTWLVQLTTPLFEFLNHGFSVRDLVLLVGGLFLMAKAASEIFHFVEYEGHSTNPAISKVKASFNSVVIQIVIFDIIFSLDSVLTAVGLTDNLYIMIFAVMASITFMLIFVNEISEFVENNPAIKVLALSFLILIGMLLVAEGAGQHFERGYVYFAMAFSLGVELLNRRKKRKSKLL